GESAVRQATLTSAVLALLAALLSVSLSLSLVMARRALALRRRVGARTLLEYATDTGAGFVLVVPPVVIGAGWFLLLRSVSD
ncbi:MAG: thiamine/thiamine pyrophosphate ABC transporter permease ThiP, partial [Mesorhizobium sp.]